MSWLKLNLERLLETKRKYWEEQFNGLKTVQDRKYALWDLFEHMKKAGYVIMKFVGSNQVISYGRDGRLLYNSDYDEMTPVEMHKLLSKIVRDIYTRQKATALTNQLQLEAEESRWWDIFCEGFKDTIIDRVSETFPEIDGDEHAKLCESYVLKVVVEYHEKY